MKSILFLAIHRPNRSPSQRYRYEQYIPILLSNGWISEQFYLLSTSDDRYYYAFGKLLPKIFIVAKAIFKLSLRLYFGKTPDIVFVQREAFMLGTSYFERRFAKKSKLVFDFDDSIWLPAISESNKKYSFLKNPKKINEIISIADKVIVGNKYLADYAKKISNDVFIIPSTINTKLYSIKPHKLNDQVVIGWTGSFSTIPHFLTVRTVLLRIKDTYKDYISFLIIGVDNFIDSDLGIKGIQWNAETEVIDLHQMDIGIMPLPDDEWTRGKCGMKGLQYMGTGIPTVMSPVGVNNDIIQDGVNGFLAATEEEWFHKLSALIESPELRKMLGENGRKTVEEKYSVKANAPLYLELFNQVLSTP